MFGWGRRGTLGATRETSTTEVRLTALGEVGLGILEGLVITGGSVGVVVTSGVKDWVLVGVFRKPLSWRVDLNA